MTTPTLCRSLMRFYTGKLLTLLLVVGVLYFSYRTIKNLNNGYSSFKNVQLDSANQHTDSYINIDEHREISPSKFIDNDHYRKSCPICFGKTICDSIEVGALIVSSKKSEDDNKIVYEGKWHKTSKVLVKVIKEKSVAVYKQFVCRNMTDDHDCKSLKEKLILFEPNLLNVPSVQNIYKLALKKKSDIPAVICATEKLIAHFKSVYDLNSDGHTSNNELIMLHASIALNPEALVHMFLLKSSINLPVPYLHGVCGRVMVIEGSFKPLSDYLREPFEIRANLAVQVLQIVEDFLEEDSDWLFMFSNFNFDSLAVKEDGDVILIDLANLAIIDKSLYTYEQRAITDEQICNESCYRAYTKNLYESSDVKQSCSQLSHVSHMMYSLVCRKILSDLDEHHKDGVEGSSPHYTGLLHTSPANEKSTIEELLRECVTETSVGGRIQAAEELKDVLGEYMKDDDQIDDEPQK